MDNFLIHTVIILLFVLLSSTGAQIEPGFCKVRTADTVRTLPYLYLFVI